VDIGTNKAFSVGYGLPYSSCKLTGDDILLTTTFRNRSEFRQYLVSYEICSIIIFNNQFFARIKQQTNIWRN